MTTLTNAAGRRGWCRVLALATTALISAPAAADEGGLRGGPALGPERAGAEQKGSLLVFPLVELRWDAAGAVLQDAFLEISNDYFQGVWVQAFFVQGDPPLTADALAERSHAGWNHVGTQFYLTPSEPTYWSALTGLPKGLPPFGELDPGDPPGRPDLANPGQRTLRGFVIAWAVDAFGNEIRWNHLSGRTVLVNYADGAAWDVPPFAFQVHGVEHGQQPANCLTPNLDSGQCLSSSVIAGQIDLDGFEYEGCPSGLLFDFRAVGSVLPGAGASPPVALDTDVILLPAEFDLRQDGQWPTATKARFDIWNQNEVRFSGTERCIAGWDHTALANYTALGVPNHFLVQNLQTDVGKARIDGVSSRLCTLDDQPSHNAALLGVVQQALYFDGKVEMAAVPISVQGREAGQVRCDLVPAPPEKPIGRSRR